MSAYKEYIESHSQLLRRSKRMVEELQQGIDAAVRPADAQRYSQSVVEHANRVKRTKAELLASSQSAQAHLCKTAQVHAPEAAVILTSASGLGRVPFCGLAQVRLRRLA